MNQIDRWSEMAYNGCNMSTAMRERQPAVDPVESEIVSAIRIDAARSEPLHVQLRRELVRLLDSGQFDGTTFIAERPLARSLGISRVTVHRVLDDLRREGRLTRQVGRGTTVRPPFHARADRGQGNVDKTNAALRNVILVGHGWNSEYVRAVIGELTMVCNARKLNVSLKAVEYGKWDEFCDGVDVLADTAFLLFLGERGGRHVYDRLGSRGYRTLSLDQMSEFYHGDFVVTDARAAVGLGLEHLTSLGHQRIVLLVNECLRDESVMVKVEEFKKICLDQGIKGRIVLTGSEYFRTAQEIIDYHMPEILLGDDKTRATAVMTVSDLGAWAVLKWCREYGVSVPDDLSVVGFEDAASSAHVFPPLTTIAHPIPEVVDAALDLLMAPAGEQSNQMLINPTLVVRESTGPPRS